MARSPFIALLLTLACVRHVAAQCPDGTPPPCAGERAPMPVVAVLLFENLTSDTAAAFLAPGLTEELIRQLARMPGLRVASRFQAQRFGTGSQHAPGVIARALGASHIVSGSVQRDGGAIRVGVELTRAPGFTRVWGDRFIRRVGQLGELQDELAASVAREVLGRVVARPRQPAPPNEARERVLRGDFQLASRGAAIVHAVREYERAVAAAPEWGHAHARLAFGIALLFESGLAYAGLPMDTLLSRGEAAAARARLLAPDDADTWLAEGYLRRFRNPRTFDGVVPAFERAIALDSTNGEVHVQFAWMLALLGQDSAAEAEYRRALALNPEHQTARWELGRLYHVQGRLREALAWYDSALGHCREATPASPDCARNRVGWGVRGYRLRALAQLGDPAAVRREYEIMEAWRVATGGIRSRNAAAVAFLGQGDTAAARAALDTLLFQQRRRNPSFRLLPLEASNLAAALVPAGMREEALDAVERINNPGRATIFFLRFPDLDPIRADPRFQRVVAAARGDSP